VYCKEHWWEDITKLAAAQRIHKERIFHQRSHYNCHLHPIFDHFLLVASTNDHRKSPIHRNHCIYPKMVDCRCLSLHFDTGLNILDTFWFFSGVNLLLLLFQSTPLLYDAVRPLIVLHNVREYELCVVSLLSSINFERFLTKSYYSIPCCCCWSP